MSSLYSVVQLHGLKQVSLYCLLSFAGWYNHIHEFNTIQFDFIISFQKLGMCKTTQI